MTGAAAAGLLLGGLALSAPAHAADYGVDMQRACNTQYYLPLVAKPLDPRNPLSWRCTAVGVSNQINVARACRDQYRPQAVAVVLDQRNAYSWRCRF